MWALRAIGLLILVGCGPEAIDRVAPAARETPLPVVGGTLIALADGRVAAADPDGDRLVIGTVGEELALDEIALPPGTRPTRLVERDGRVWGIGRGGVVLAVDPDTGAVDGWPVCAEPRGIDADADGIWVTCAEGLILGLDPDGQERLRWRVDDDLRDVVAIDGTLYVARLRSAELLVVRGGEVVDRRVPPVTEGAHPAAAFAPGVAWRLVRDPLGGVLMAHQRANPGVIDLDAGFGLPAYGGASCDAVVQTGLTRFPVDGDAETVGPLLKSVLPVDVVARGDGGAWLVAAGATGISDVAVADVAPGRFAGPDARDLLDGCDMLAGIPWSAVVGDTDARVVAAAAVDGGLVMQTAAPFSLAWAPESSVTARSSAPSSLEARGHALFHAAPTGTVACASCHPEGGEDGRTWRFDEGDGPGPRRTQTLAGGVAAATMPLHWVGEHADVASLLADSFARRIGGEVAPGDDEALLRFLSEIPARIPRPVDALAERGRQVFERSGCGACHAGPWGTDGLEHDVGTGDPGGHQAFQTPSLAGLAARGPWMHDGCARTLEDRFDPACGGDRHGDPPADPADLSALIAWLQTR